MTECEACKPPLTFLSFTRPLPPSSHDLYEAHSSPAEPDPIHVDSSLVRAAFQSRDRAETLSLQDADWKHDRHSAHLVDAAAMYGYQPPNCIAVGITHGVRGAVIGSVFGGAMALSTAVQSGYRGTAAASFAGAGAVRNAAAFASWTTLYGASKCSIVRMRRRRDLLNPAIAGGFTGGVLTLISVRGQWRYNQNAILVNAAGSAMVAIMFEALSYM